jgi:transposase
MDNIFVERLWRSLKYEEVYLNAYATVAEAKAGGALQAMRGVALVVAVTVVAEVGDSRRFANARQLMAYLGLVPSEHSSGSTIRRVGITKAGNALARRVLIEGVWTYRMTARVSRKLHDRLEPLSAAIRDIAWKRRSGCVSQSGLARMIRCGTIQASRRTVIGFWKGRSPANSWPRCCRSRGSSACSRASTSRWTAH